MRRHESRCFRTEARLAEAHWLEAEQQCLCHFLLTEVAFGTYQYQRILAGHEGFLQELLLTFVTMANELLPLELLRDELVEVGHLIEHGLGSFQ